MNNRVRVIFCGVMIVLLALISAFSVIPARADDGAPPPPAGGASPMTSTPAVLSQASSTGTDVVVVNNAGHKVPLASQEAARIVAAGDPMWCPTGVVPGSATCSPAHNLSFQNVITWLGTQTKGKAGVIWVEWDYDRPANDTSTAFTLNGNINLPQFAPFSLTVNGGWKGTGTGLNSSTPSVIDGASLSILNWKNTITLNNITIKNSPVASNGLTVTTTGSIILNNFDAIANGLDGADLDNSSATSAKPVTLTGVNVFSENVGGGLHVASKGAIKAGNVVVDDNGQWGAILDNQTAATAQPITLTGTNEFKFNGTWGLMIYSKGAVTLNKIAANNNGRMGLGVANTFGGPGSPQNVTVTGYGNFNFNGESGLEVYTYGAITLANISAHDNGQSSSGYGAYLNNYGGDPIFSGGYAAHPKPVTLSVSGGNPDTNLDKNYSGGLVVYSLGAINLAGVIAEDTINGNGVWLENDFSGAVGGITISGWGAASSNNTGYGWLIESRGAITATGLWAMGNGLYGAIIDNHLGTGAVTLGTLKLNGGTAYGYNIGGDGLDVYSKGTITLLNVNADGNSGNGVLLDNCLLAGFVCTGHGNIIIKNNGKNTGTYSPSFNNNGDTGLIVYSYGTITLMDATADNNGQNNITAADAGNPIDNSVGYGIYLDNHLGTGSVTVGTSRANWCNSMSDNFQSGLEVYSSGAVTMSNMCNNGNGGYYSVTGFVEGVDRGYGAYIINSTGSLKPVTVNSSKKTTNDFYSNYDTGLYISSLGAIKVNNLDANYNGNDGLDVYSHGTITLIDASSYNNGQNNFNAANGGTTIDDSVGYGIVLDNHLGTGSVTVGNSGANGCNWMSYNFQSGLEVYSSGAVTMSNICNNGNGGYKNVTGFVEGVDRGYGAYIINSTGSLKPVTVNSSKNSMNDFYGNYDTGLYISSLGDIKVNNLNVNNNGNDGLRVLTHGMIALVNLDAENNGQNSFFTSGWGVYLDNRTSTGAPKGITLNGANTFNGNFKDGLWATSLGSISSVKQMTANDNGGDGAYLDNQWNGAVGSITVTSSIVTDLNQFNSNDSNGLEVYSNRAVKLSNIQASGNLNDGALVDTADHTGAYAAQNVTLSGRNSFDSNGQSGLMVTADGNITINNLTANSNTNGMGAWLENCLAVGPACIGHGNITLTGTNNFNGNTNGNGLYADSSGNITISKVTADNNQFEGVVGGAFGKILVSCGSMTNNRLYGWEFGVPSTQTITLKGVFAYGNNGGLGDTYLDSGTLVTSLSCP